jgi:hypothetical protein
MRTAIAYVSFTNDAEFFELTLEGSLEHPFDDGSAYIKAKLVRMEKEFKDGDEPSFIYVGDKTVHLSKAHIVSMEIWQES